MANLSINLLPQELTAEKKARQKSALVIQVCVILLVLLIVSAGIILSFRFAQTAQLTKLKSQTESTRAQINTPENSKKEGLVVTLNSRLDNLATLNNTSYPASYSLSLLTKMLPPGITIVSFTVDRKGDAQLQVNTPDTATLFTLLNNIMDPNLNEQKFTSAAIDTISLNRIATLDTGIILKLSGGVKQ